VFVDCAMMRTRSEPATPPVSSRTTASASSARAGGWTAFGRDHSNFGVPLSLGKSAQAVLATPDVRAVIGSGPACCRASDLRCRFCPQRRRTRTGEHCGADAAVPFNVFQTNLAGVLAVGDVRSGSVKTVASAVGRGISRRSGDSGPACLASPARRTRAGYALRLRRAQRGVSFTPSKAAPKYALLLT
jgi:hypothetical protein